jgi:hypothetical protein
MKKIKNLSNEHLFILLASLIAILYRTIFSFYTDRTWEDALITVLHAENFWNGLGLTHVRSDQGVIHGFTSPISLIIPLIGGYFGYALPFQKLVSVIISILPIIFTAKIYKLVFNKIDLSIFLFTFLYLALEHHQVLWGMAGMETQVVVAILFFCFYACSKPSPSLIGISTALAMYARPDFLFLVMIVFLFILIFNREILIKSIMISAAIYLPWIIFTTIYYGSPIPNTILAKLYGYASISSPHLSKFLDLLVPLGPSFAGHGTGYWREWDKGYISLFVLVLYLIGSLKALIKKQRALYVPVFFVLVYWAYYVFLVNAVFGWYVVPLSATTIFIAGYGLRSIFRNPLPSNLCATVYIVCMLTVLIPNLNAERDIQHLIENNVRLKFSEWLRDNTPKNATIGLEPLGYSAYYSHRDIYDYPGLANKKVVKYLKENQGVGFCDMLEHFEPDFLVLRPHECKDLAFLKRDYSFIKEFGAAQDVQNIKGINHNIDVHFLIYKKN